MLTTILIIFIALVIAIALITAKLNARTPCNHQWKEADGYIICGKCNKVITGGHITSDAELENDAISENDEIGRFA